MIFYTRHLKHINKHLLFNLVLLTVLVGSVRTIKFLSSTTWTKAMSPIILDDQYYVLPGEMLTIEAGTVLASTLCNCGQIVTLLGAQIYVDSTGPVDPIHTQVSLQAPPGGSGEIPPAELSNCCCEPCEEEAEKTGNSVYGFSGEFHETAVDMCIPGRGFDFIWTRKYRSRIAPKTEQGNGWDFSYNIYLKQDGGDLVLFDGNTRSDVYIEQAKATGGESNGIWICEGFFRELKQDDPNDVNSDFTLVFSDATKWHFHGFGHPNAPGKINAIVDRNDNTMLFDYDLMGRLSTIHDTLDSENKNREIIVEYNDNNLIASITDFVCRQVTYEYYSMGDPNGSPGDLKSVTTPSVTGTPTNNDFPHGKTTTYTYSTGFLGDPLNHNLLTITDPKGQTYLRNIYDPTEDPNDTNYDRIQRQVLGNTGDNIDYTYNTQIPELDNNFAINKCIKNDREGNVKEYFYDEFNRLIQVREFTGRADPEQPTNDTLNRPMGRLHFIDPGYFETKYNWNLDSRITQIIYPSGNLKNFVYESDLDPNAPQRSRGNVREIHHLPGPMEAISDQTEIVEKFDYDDNFGCGDCGSNFVTRHIDGRGNEILHDYDNRGNRIHTQHRIPSIVEDWEYNEFGQMTKHILPDNGSGHRRVDVYKYYTTLTAADLNGDGCVDLVDFSWFAFFWLWNANSIVDIAPAGGDGVVDLLDLFEFASLWLECVDPIGINPQGGYLSHIIVDVNNLALTTTYEYDEVGNVLRLIDPRGNDTQFIYNELDQLVREISRSVTKPNDLRYQKDYFYDKNDNIVRVDIQNIDEKGIIQNNTHFTTIYEYEILNKPTIICKEVGSYTGTIPGPVDQPTRVGLPENNFITAEYGYDENRNLVLKRSSEAVEGREPNNTVSIYYDERNLIYQVIRAVDDQLRSTVQYDYDGNRNRTVARVGLEDNPSITRFQYDGFNRVTVATNPMGNKTIYHYDENSNIVSQRKDGELIDQAGGAGNIRLWEATYDYDSMDRRTHITIQYFDPNTQSAISDGNSVTEIQYSDASQVASIRNDNNHVTQTAYDTANRRSIDVDARGNTNLYSYDRNSNLITVTNVDKSDLGDPDQAFTTTYSYDSLDRRVQAVDNVGNTTLYEYDSRDNRTSNTDARGNKISYSYDGLNRLIQTIQDLDGDGADGDGDDITISRTWDDNSRLTGKTDDNGNTTGYEYDSLNRLSKILYADGTSRRVVHTVHNDIVETTDAMGTVVHYTYDSLSRIINKMVISGPSVSNDTTYENYRYDGLSRLVSVEDDDSVVTRSYDSLSNLMEETQNGRTITYAYDDVGNRVQCTYPGDRVITTTYDVLERRETISDPNGLIASYDYIGPDRVKRRDYGNGTRTEVTYDGITDIANPPGDYGVGRMIRTKHTLISNGGIIDERTFAYDFVSNKTRRKDVRAGEPQLTHDYAYDAAYRLISTDVTGGALRTTDYTLDGVGNRTAVVGFPGPGNYTMDNTIPPADEQMNQYTSTPFDNRLYDENGNLIRIDYMLPNRRDFVYDYRNRMVKHTDPNGTVTTYSYDALDRRIERVVDTDRNPQTTRYLYDGWQVIEERNDLDVTQATYVYGNYIDEVLNMQRDNNDYYYHTDDMVNVMAVTNGTGDVVERYEYGDFGNPEILDWTGTPIPTTTISNPYLFTGRRYDPETGLYYYRNRYYDSKTGKFLTRDTLGIWGDADNLGNSMTYCSNDPWNRIDPFGLTKTEIKRSTYNPSKRYLGVREQQGRMQTENDFGEEGDLYFILNPLDMFGTFTFERYQDNGCLTYNDAAGACEFLTWPLNSVLLVNKGNWKEGHERLTEHERRNPADLSILLVEILAWVSDQLSSYQDAIVTEAYLGTARKRTSIHRHARKLNYPMHEGCNALVWICLEVENIVYGSAIPLHVYQEQARIADCDGDIINCVVSSKTIKLVEDEEKD